MEAFFIRAGQLLLCLSILVILHELGHFIPAKLFKTRVEKFFLFFDVKFALFKKKIGETVYGIGWLPLGGYVKIAGMIEHGQGTDGTTCPTLGIQKQTCMATLDYYDWRSYGEPYLGDSHLCHDF